MTFANERFRKQRLWRYLLYRWTLAEKFRFVGRFRPMHEHQAGRIVKRNTSSVWRTSISRIAVKRQGISACVRKSRIPAGEIARLRGNLRPASCSGRNQDPDGDYGYYAGEAGYSAGPFRPVSQTVSGLRGKTQKALNDMEMREQESRI